MSARIVVATCLAVVVAANPAGAKTAKRVCSIVTDVTNDTDLPYDANVDVVSADVATNATQLTAVVRVAGSTTEWIDPAAPGGRRLRLEVLGAGSATPIALAYVVEPQSAYAVYEVWSKEATDFVTWNEPVPFHATGSTVTMTIPLSVLKKLGRFTPGARLSAVRATTWRIVEVDDPDGTTTVTYPYVSDTTAKASYVAGTPSCVKVGF